LLSVSDQLGTRLAWERWPLAIRHQLGTDDGHVARGVDPQAHLAPLQPHHGDTDVITDEEPFHELSSQHEHISRPYAK
jgi:hypothetical protein